MAALPENVKTRIVQGLACYDTPSQVSKDIYAAFGLHVTPQHCEIYDPTKAAGKGLGKKFRAIFEETRRTFLKDLGQIAMSHRAVRMRRLERFIDRAESAGNIGMAAQLIEQVSRECEGAELAQLQARLDALMGGKKA